MAEIINNKNANANENFNEQKKKKNQRIEVFRARIEYGGAVIEKFLNTKMKVENL